ncbi:Gfo/Idh/MocA family oxidoreductase [Methylobacterium sp. NMS14P]|uniref:Gfo/Idh/MocA family protein n=1 Tax=Methylobacterium sp. NMS14P TaxID=2894310 RepID=UPI0023591FC6|nr:Gfo/Idh/MocA family oxidoreductase [Methylobacterium sp. NMS14P]WCS27713.1 Gfo/Idh/MocA family oxidoreductase [Methylobacterium sp. NMS14P]
MAQTVSWGVLGTGTIAQRFVSDLLGRPDARLAAVGARSAGSAQAFAQAFTQASGPPTAVAGVEALAARPDVDIVYIATPNSDHMASALACIEAGKSVLIEKPIALSGGQARRIAEAAQRKGVFCMEAMWMRFTPGVVRAKAMLEAGEIGDPLHLDARLFFPRSPPPPGRTDDPAEGGVILDLGIYPVSLALHLFGAPAQVSGATVDRGGAATQQAALALAWPDKTATLSCGSTGEADNAAVIVGARGRIHLHRQFLCPPFLTRVRTAPAPAPADRAPPRRQAVGRLAFAKRLLQPLDFRRVALIPTPYRGFGLRHQIDEVHRCLRAGARESPTMPLADSVRALDILDRVRARPQPLDAVA